MTSQACTITSVWQEVCQHIDNRGIGIGNLSHDAAPCVLRFRSLLPILNGVSGARVVVCD